jgi:hypothetical protein
MGKQGQHLSSLTQENQVLTPAQTRHPRRQLQKSLALASSAGEPVSHWIPHRSISCELSHTLGLKDRKLRRSRKKEQKISTLHRVFQFYLEETVLILLP